MKTYLKLFSAIRPSGTQISKMFSFTNLWKGVSPFIKKLCFLVFGKPSLVALRSKSFYSFVCHLISMHKKHGSTLTVKWLKSCYVCLQRYLGDDRISTLRDIEPNLPLPRLINGLPSIIPKGDRRQIKLGNTKIIQWWLSSFSIYRVLECEVNPKINSITDPFSGNIEWLKSLEDQIDYSPFMNLFKKLKGFNEWKDNVNLYPHKLTFFQTSSPSNNVSWHGILTDLILLRTTGMCYQFDNYTRLVGNKYINHVINDCMDIVDSNYPIIAKANPKLKMINPEVWLPCTKSGNFSGLVGQLSYKVEAAGKLRIFAMVDFWTQNVLKPLHRELFNLLKLIPNDGTFDQDASVKRSILKSRISGKAFSFDLSSATDRLPISLQSKILDLIMPIKIGEAWKALLVDRYYYLPELEGKIKEDKIKYAVGQPMGALSSWAMLAITHHFILQLCSFEKGERGWNENYEILGDDLVIFDEKLASLYLEMCSKLGVDINLSKSIVSPNKASFEFAKRMIYDGHNVSAISLKQLISETSMGARLNNIYYFGKLGLIRTNTVLQTLLSRFGNYKSLKDLNYPLISLLGLILNLRIISPKDIVKVLVDWKDEEWDLDSEVSLPYQSVLTSIKGLLPNCAESTKEKGQINMLNIPHSDDREEYAEDHTLLLADMVVLHALALAKDIERNFDMWKSQIDWKPFGSWTSLKKIEGAVASGEWIFDLIDNFENFDPTDFVDQIEKIAIKQAKIHNLDFHQAVELFDKVDAVRQKFNIGAKVSKVEKVKERASPFYGYLLQNLGARNNLSYLKLRPNYFY